MPDKTRSPRIQRRLVLDSVPYTVTIKPHSAGFRARWFCGGCSSHNADLLIAAAAEAASAAAEENLRAHHAAVHVKPPRRY